MGDGGGAELLIEGDIAPFGAERRLDGARQDIDAPLQRAACLLVKDQLLCHGVLYTPPECVECTVESVLT